MSRSPLVHILLAVLAPWPAAACTSFALGDTVRVAAKNYDWDIGLGMVIVNQRHVEKSVSIVPDSSDSTWIARHGSVTFNQYGRDLPQGGMNEEGVVVEALWLEGTSYPPDDERLDVGCAQWVQYALDTASTVEEVLATLGAVQIRSTVPLHFFIADRHGGVASLEFLQGREVIHTGDGMPLSVLTNTPYAEALDYYRGRMDGSLPEEPSATRSRNRFVRAATLIATLQPAVHDPVDNAFVILSAVAHPEFTQWSIVYDQTRRIVHVSTRETPARRVIAMANLDLDCGKAVMTALLGSGAGNDVRWRPYTREANLDLIRRAYAATDFLRGTPGSVLEAIAAYPERSRCVR